MTVFLDRRAWGAYGLGTASCILHPMLLGNQSSSHYPLSFTFHSSNLHASPSPEYLRQISFAICSMSTTPSARLDYVLPVKSLHLRGSFLFALFQMAHTIQRIPYPHLPSLHPDKILLIPFMLARLLRYPTIILSSAHRRSDFCSPCL